MIPFFQYKVPPYTMTCQLYQKYEVKLLKVVLLPYFIVFKAISRTIEIRKDKYSIPWGVCIKYSFKLPLSQNNNFIPSSYLFSFIDCIVFLWKIKLSSIPYSKASQPPQGLII